MYGLLYGVRFILYITPWSKSVYEFFKLFSYLTFSNAHMNSFNRTHIWIFHIHIKRELVVITFSIFFFTFIFAVKNIMCRKKIKSKKCYNKNDGSYITMMPSFKAKRKLWGFFGT